MRIRSTAILAIALGMTAQSGHAVEYNFVPGLWETTTTSQLIGVPPEIGAMMQMQMPPQTERACVTADDLQFGAGDQCQYTNERVNASKLAVTVTCNTPLGPAHGSGEVNLQGKNSSGWFEMSIPQSLAGPMTMKTVFSSRYLGACR